MELNNSCLAGSTLLPLTLNGGFFEVVSPTGGRYGFVHFKASLWSWHAEADLLFRFILSHVWLALSA